MRGILCWKVNAVNFLILSKYLRIVDCEYTLNVCVRFIIFLVFNNRTENLMYTKFLLFYETELLALVR